MSGLNTVIVDDEGPARRGLALLLQQHHDINITHQCRNGREALLTLKENPVDLVFLDIQMPGMSGFDVIRALPADTLPQIIFVTAFDQFALKAFRYNAVDYLLKPLNEEHLAEALARARKKRQQHEVIARNYNLETLVRQLTDSNVTEASNNPYKNVIAIRSEEGILRLPINRINWVEAAGDYMCIHTDSEVHIHRITLKKLEAQLDPACFQRIHRSIIVNLQRVDRICNHINGEYFLVLRCGARLKMSRSYKDKIDCLI